MLGGGAALRTGQIGTGSAIGDLLEQGGAEKKGFQWVHGPSLNPFQPHEDLDGVEFENFDDDVLANNTGFPDNAYFIPGDHWGCTCDFMPLWDIDSGSVESTYDEELTPVYTFDDGMRTIRPIIEEVEFGNLSGLDEESVKVWSDTTRVSGDAKAAKLDVKAAKAYQGAGFRSINEALRTGKTKTISLEDLKAKTIDPLDNLISEQLPTSADSTLYRGVSRSVIGDLKEGDEFSDAGYASTAPDQRGATLSFQKSEADSGVLKIRAPAGSKGLRIEGVTGKGMGENEVVLPRGARMRVISSEDVHMQIRRDSDIHALVEAGTPGKGFRTIRLVTVELLP